LKIEPRAARGFAVTVRSSGRQEADVRVCSRRREHRPIDARDGEKLRAGYVVSGSWAANVLTPIAPTRLLLCCADDVPALAKRLELRQVDAGMNVVLAQPFDPVVAERTSKRDGLTIAAPSQVVADLLTSPGRGPNKAEALIEWMRKNENAWRK
jgi:hypothetical protein